MAYDAGLVARVEDALAGLGERGVRQRNVFGGRGFLASRSTFAIVFDEELIVKLPRADYDRSLALAGVRAFAPGDEKPMTTWVVVSADAIAEDPELCDWLRLGLEAVRRGSRPASG
jgi:TfoX/Sxy family transcriptional regulator of competence genes